VNKFFGFVIVVALVIGIVAGYWYLNPRHMPAFLRNQISTIRSPAERSPMKDFRPPQF
jgi:hypothetical protein